MGTGGGDDRDKEERIGVAVTEVLGARKSLIEELGEDSDEGGEENYETEKSEEHVMVMELEKVGLGEKELQKEKEKEGVRMEDGSSKGDTSKVSSQEGGAEEGGKVGMVTPKGNEGKEGGEVRKKQWKRAARGGVRNKEKKMGEGGDERRAGEHTVLGKRKDADGEGGNNMVMEVDGADEAKKRKMFLGKEPVSISAEGTESLFCRKP